MIRNVASQKWRVYAWDATTGLPKTGDAANISAKIQIDDGAEATTNDTAPTEVQATNQKGYYEFDLTQAETNGAKLSLAPQSSTANIVVIACPPVVYTIPSGLSDLTIANNAVASNVTRWLGTAAATPTVAGVPEVDVTHVAGSTTDVSTIPASVAAILVDTGTTLDGMLVTIDNFLDTEIAAIITTLGTPAGVSIAADLLVIDNFVDGLETTIGAAGAGLSAIPWNAAWDAEVQSEVDDAIVAQRLDELLNADSDIDGAAPPTVGSVFHELMSKTAGSFTFDQTTDSNEALRDRGDAAWITATGFSTLDAAGVRTAVGLASANLDTQLTAIDDYLDTEVAAILAAVDTEIATIVTAVGTTIPNTLSGLFTTALTESYRGAGAAGSVSQYLHELIAHHGEKSIASTTMTLKKLDGSTTAKTYTLDSATTPTSVTETT